jgi:hypothetical protein
LRRIVEKKLWPEKRTMITWCDARRTTSRSPGVKVVPPWPSTVTQRSSTASSACTVTSAFGASRSGRIARVCAEIGVRRMVSSVGTTTAPPADRL